jgi:hypothetical protein
VIYGSKVTQNQLPRTVKQKWSCLFLCGRPVIDARWRKLRLYLVGSQGMWHGGIHITDATIPWCALSTDSEAENEYCRELYKGEQFIRCMADGEIVAWRVSKDYESAAIEWRGEKLLLSTSFVLVKHYIQPGDTEESGLTFFTLYMNLAPYAAYKKQGSMSDRKVSGVQRYYTSAEDLQAGREAGKLAKDTPVTLSDTIVTRSDRRQFTEVTITGETKNTAGETLAAGMKVWTVSDRGSLKAVASAPVPSWWAKCSPSYITQQEGVVNCTSRTDWSYYLSSDDVRNIKMQADWWQVSRFLTSLVIPHSRLSARAGTLAMQQEHSVWSLWAGIRIS